MEVLPDGTHLEQFRYAAAREIGEIGAVVFINMGSGPFADWEVQKVVVEKVVEGGLESGSVWQQWVIPCYGWVPPMAKRHFFEATAKLPAQ
eukprot:CAMPEP_0117659418 /NCGR_PEP_ID=MMETSP0804-20121206/6422_1 /TAXON_ID=1074897 /ORGANISM="Tetraselmis astigmatica, Strain CCMP880" /LENGTH=90 /DNA_ID=CAMNT_0005466075 /DNA_START=535 /DNA_END=804 /DNA_ORIENTATION=+